MVEVTQLPWEPVEQARSDADPTTEVVGWEATTPFGTFYQIEEYFGSDSLGWEVTHSMDYLGEADCPETAKALAQTDFANRIAQAIRAASDD